VQGGEGNGSNGGDFIISTNMADILVRGTIVRSIACSSLLPSLSHACTMACWLQSRSQSRWAREVT
jgi:archaellum component FlaF (FlaF/FlaG flagellin family)